MSSSLFKQMTWTAIALHKLSFKEPVADVGKERKTLTFKRWKYTHEGKQYQSSAQVFLRDDIFTEEAIQDHITEALIEGFDIPPTNISAHVNRIPLKLAERRGQSHDGGLRRWFHPVKVVDCDIGSNVGFVSFVNDIRLMFERDERFILLLCDVNLYKRLLKVPQILHFSECPI